jgi:hypothetical protein
VGDLAVPSARGALCGHIPERRSRSDVTDARPRCSPGEGVWRPATRRVVRTISESAATQDARLCFRVKGVARDLRLRGTTPEVRLWPHHAWVAIGSHTAGETPLIDLDASVLSCGVGRPTDSWASGVGVSIPPGRCTCDGRPSVGYFWIEDRPPAAAYDQVVGTSDVALLVAGWRGGRRPRSRLGGSRRSRR